ncbi:MAG: hypothetical protein Q4Q23_07780 [Methanobacteriaceae archaeon]|nr:hypothetical protein [Methanobacteriaceae archaeon]
MTSCNSLVNTTCPVVLLFTVQNNNTDIPNTSNYKLFYIDIYHYNSTGELKLLDHEIPTRIAIFNITNLPSININTTENNIRYNYQGLFPGLTVTVDDQQVSIPPNFKYQTYISFDNMIGWTNHTLTINATVHNYYHTLVSGSTRVVIKINGRTISTLT